MERAAERKAENFPPLVDNFGVCSRVCEVQECYDLQMKKCFHGSADRNDLCERRRKKYIEAVGKEENILSISIIRRERKNKKEDVEPSSCFTLTLSNGDCRFQHLFAKTLIRINL